MPGRLLQPILRLYPNAKRYCWEITVTADSGVFTASAASYVGQYIYVEPFGTLRIIKKVSDTVLQCYAEIPLYDIMLLHLATGRLKLVMRKAGQYRADGQEQRHSMKTVFTSVDLSNAKTPYGVLALLIISTLTLARLWMMKPLNQRLIQLNLMRLQISRLGLCCGYSQLAESLLFIKMAQIL
jgi:hypothetical protein